MLEPKGRVERLQRRALSHLRSPCSRPSRRLSGAPSSLSSPSPYPYRVIGMVMIAFVGVATFDTSGTGATSILQAVIWVSPKRQLRNATLAPSCSYYASCAAARGGWVCTLGSQPVVMPYRIPGTQVSLSIEVGRGLSKGPLCVVEWSRGRGAYCCSCFVHGVFDLIQPPTTVRGLHTEVIAQKA
jgi:hypothetical protein